MLYYIIGSVTEKYRDSVIVECSGIGYRLYMTISSLNKIECSDQQKKFYTYLCVREDNFTLYGFLNREDKDFFEKLLTVSGIGPKAALNILSGISVKDIVSSIINDDVTRLTKIPGIGKKTAQRMIVELKEKLKHYNISETTDISVDDNIVSEAVTALVSLGYSAAEAKEAISMSNCKSDKVEDMIFAALKKMDTNK